MSSRPRAKVHERNMFYMDLGGLTQGQAAAKSGTQESWKSRQDILAQKGVLSM